MHGFSSEPPQLIAKTFCWYSFEPVRKDQRKKSSKSSSKNKKKSARKFSLSRKSSTRSSCGSLPSGNIIVRKQSTICRKNSRLGKIRPKQKRGLTFRGAVLVIVVLRKWVKVARSNRWEGVVKVVYFSLSS